ncbi:MBOAT-domain-containing protein [Wallemia mellicola]|nr:MBOAT-domain-containing protein [Wallemia mellicola]
MIDDFYSGLSAKVGGIPIDHLKVVFLRIPSQYPSLRNAFNLLCSLFFLIGIFDLKYGLLNLLFNSIVSFYLAKSFSAYSWMPWVVMGFAMTHLLLFHIQRLIHVTPSTAIEISGSLMVLIQRTTTYAWNVHDGQLKEEELEDYQKDNRVMKQPPLLGFLAYTLYFPAILVGPAFPYDAYASLVDNSLFETSRPRKLKGRRRAGYRRMVFGLIFMALYAVFGGSTDMGFLIDSEWKKNHGILSRIAFLQKSAVVTRCKYYAVWSISEGACIISGLGFNGYNEKNGRTRWDRVRNIDVLGVELAQNVKELLDAWNMNTNVWLRSCVYKRVTTKGKKPGFQSTLITFVTSAFWHGLPMGYYLTFIYGGFLQALGKLVRKNIRPFFIDTSKKPLYDVLSIVTTQMLINFAIIPFMLLGFKNSLKGWYSVGGYGIIVVIVAFNYFKYMGGTDRLQTKLKQRRDDALEELFDGTPTAEMRDKAGLDEELLTRDVDEIMEKLTKHGTLASREAADQIKDLSNEGKTITKGVVKDAVNVSKSE